MALRDHYLDNVFDDASDLDALTKAFREDKRISAAFAMAVVAYNKMKKEYAETTGLCGPNPAQAALSIWLDVLDLRRDNDREDR